jgi:glucoamylase
MKFLFLLLIPSLCWSAIPTKDEQFLNSLSMVISNATRPDVKPGMVVASPSKEAPNYYYDWVRDTALTMRSLVDYYQLSNDQKIKKMIFTWIDAEAYRQNLPTYSGLGEPKYNIDGSGFTGPWGRPQNDGPALRAITMIKFARIMFSEGNQDYVLKNLYHGVLPADSVIKKDLEYVAHHWEEHSFDLWEEEKGMHFYTLLSQHVALQEGAKLADELKDSNAAVFYRQESERIARKLKTEFTDERVGILVTSQKSAPLGYKNSGIDVAPLLALLHTSPYQKLFSLKDSYILKYVDVLTNTFTDIYSVNKKYLDLGVGIGRYPEDRYDGYQTSALGNPWFLSTLALGEYYCLLKDELMKNGKLTRVLAKDLSDMTENQFKRALFHSDRKGHISEQFNHETGIMQGAVDLTWSHNSFMTAMMRCRLVKK